MGLTSRRKGLAWAAALAVAVAGCPRPAPPRPHRAPAASTSHPPSGIDRDRPGVTTGRVIDSRGDPIPHLILRLFEGETETLECTQDDGRFATSRLALGVTYAVDACLGAGQLASRPDGRCRLGTVRAGDKDIDLRLPYASVALAEGRVVDVDSTPLVGWRVDARRDGTPPDSGPIAADFTDERGTFRITAWERSDFTLKLSSPRGGSRRIVRTFVAEGDSAPTLVAGPPGIAGRVTSWTGPGPSGALVRLRRAGDPAFERTSVVDAIGEFRFEDLASSEEYELTAELAGWDLLHPVRCDLDTGAQKLELLARRQTITGRLLAPDGAPRIATWLRFFPVGGGRVFQTCTGTDGAFVTHEAREVEYDVAPLVAGPDGRLVPGATIGRCFGGARDVVLRATR